MPTVPIKAQQVFGEFQIIYFCWKIPKSYLTEVQLWQVPNRLGKSLKQKSGVFWKLQEISGTLVLKYIYIYLCITEIIEAEVGEYSCFLNNWDQKSPKNPLKIPQKIPGWPKCYISVRAQPITSQGNHLDPLKQKLYAHSDDQGPTGFRPFVEWIIHPGTENPYIYFFMG